MPDGAPPPEPDAWAGMPHCRAEERAILAALLIDPTASVELEPEHFYFDCNQLVFAAVLATPNRDAVAVAEELRRGRVMYRVGGALYLAELLDTEPAWDVEAFAWRVREAWRARRLIRVLATVQAELYAGLGADEAWRRVKECAA